jgi:spore maturation protein CgeB
MPDQFLKWGAKNASFIPLGAISSQFDDIDESELFAKNRTTDIVFVGSSTTVERNMKLFKVKQYFGNRFKIYGQWHWKSNVKNIVVNKNRYWIKPHYDIKSLYMHSKIGINIHDSDSYGFGNRRTYELPLNGVMLVCDFKTSFLENIYKLNKEAVGYETIDEAIGLIDYYLTHEDERMEIAVNGFRKAKEKYLFSSLFMEILKTIDSEIRLSQNSTSFIIT